jgi:heme/copper-type cytochrome/quinol oxidase subunit 3
MYMSKCCGLLMFIIPIAFLFTTAFFVLFTLRKVEEKRLKVFGHVAVSFLLLATLIILLGAISNLVKAPQGMKCLMRQRANCGMTQMMQKNSMPGMNM